MSETDMSTDSLEDRKGDQQLGDSLADSLSAYTGENGCDEVRVRQEAKERKCQFTFA